MASPLTATTEHTDLNVASAAANFEATAVGGRVFPCVVFKQGSRTMVSTSFPYSFIARNVVTNSALKGESPRESQNRPLMPEHAKSIKEYVVANASDYILPPVTLAVTEHPSLHVVGAPGAAIRMGFMVVDDTVPFTVTDGQHRIAGLVGYPSGRSTAPGALDAVPGLSKDGMAVLIVIETDRIRIQQDFADAAQTKQIPPSLLAVYNTREPVNRVLSQITTKARLFKGRIDESSKTLPKASQHVFLLNQVRGFVKEMLFGDYAMSEDSLTKQTAQRLATGDKQEEFINDTLTMLEVLTEHMEPWSTIARIQPGTGVANQIPDFRATYINMTATGLNIIGRMGYEIGKEPSAELRRDRYAALATKIDWRRDAPLWKGTIISAENKIATQRGPVNAAAARVREALGF
ncbi:DGQHR domain-containing protein [Micromonospora luteifusca]|uniref:DGQHR domain-containing protein n=1 Tax=Micromonospora luteifusca TaxID=709860 RepID=A0ABS2LUR9_9ACTN|nr:DNA sulfur modification protein DndB [Micromonospora luteifusca]MBM7491930.1 DGQHR domain-containing protein [Micromonospora luteifusca]